MLRGGRIGEQWLVSEATAACACVQGIQVAAVAGEGKGGVIQHREPALEGWLILPLWF